MIELSFTFRNPFSFQVVKCVRNIWNVYLEFGHIVNGVILVIWNALERYRFCLLIASEWG